MKSRMPLACVVALAALAGPAVGADPIPPGFRGAFEGRVRRGTFAVVAQPGIPTVPVHGPDGKQVDAYYSVDIRQGRWEPSQGLLDLNQVEADHLRPGEVMEVVDVTFKDKDNRIDVRLVSRDAHEVVRSSRSGPKATSEPVGTNFKFFLPFPLDSARDVAAAIDYVEGFLRLFRHEDEASAYSSWLAARNGGPPAAAAAKQPVAPQQIKAGMTPLEVIEMLGKPDREVTFGSQSKWTYRDLIVVFDNGRVKEVRF